MSQLWGPYLKGLREAAVAAGNCFECRCRPARPGKRRCVECTERNRATRESHVERGLCRELCGKPAAQGKTRCDEHLLKARIAMRLRRSRRLGEAA